MTPAAASGEPKDISDWIATVGEVARNNGWGQNRRSILERLALIYEELGEATGALRIGMGEVTEISVDTTGKPEGFAIELADVVMRIFTLCHEEEIDLENAMRTKLDFNRSRSWRHGGRVF